MTQIETALASVIPNLDADIPPKQLGQYEAHLKEVAGHLRTLASYCEGKRHATEARLAGKIEMALKFEAACDAVYARLPEWAKW